MALQQKVGRLLIAGFHGKTVSNGIKHLIHSYHIGGVILFRRNIGTPAEVLKLTRSLQKEAKDAGYAVPLLVCLDQENGMVRRIGEGTTSIPGAMLLGATHEPDLAQKAGAMTGTELKALGVNWNLAPVADINNNPKNPVIGVRSFGEKADHVTEMAKGFMAGMRRAGVASTLKHFPGHGDTTVDSHLDLPIISHGMERLREVELVPFKECIARGADAVMGAHVYFPALEKEENTPATLSHSVITGLLREELGFDGVITTDCMEMDAIAKGIGTVKGCVKAVQAGVDLVMVSHQHDLQEQAVLQLAEAVGKGVIAEQQIDQSIARIEQMISNYTNWGEIEAVQELPALVGSEAHQKQMKPIYQAGVTVIGNKGKPIGAEDRVLLISPMDGAGSLAESKTSRTALLAEALRKLHPLAESIEVELDDDVEVAAFSDSLKSADHVVVVTMDAVRFAAQSRLVNLLIGSGKPVDVVAVRTPYDAAMFPGANRILCTYEYTLAALEIAAEVLVGKTEAKGKLPVTLEIHSKRI
ncbi:beta-N-acetylhexosaminidase [Planomicrobium sp. CPCC 101079]|uniref:beta-N-acetylhexosaminidase n=1 Tax=Planomicrobium sp. CPCC 101079 TaxID=2599618 RepID=UPI0011B3ED33|nr:beta-N-acetylhexosaminidase [Planomicrobium sp. CPCC 101079]TWT13307.1 beta-N-acetylhexosaminidase [Planomicrobium sp. CPCC 101079]